MSDIRMKRRGAGRTARAALAAVLVTGALGIAPVGLTTPAAAGERAREAGASTAPAGSEAQAMDEAKRTGKPVEVTAERSETSETYALPNGNIRHTQHTSPVRVKREGSWLPVDTDLTEAAGRIAPKAAAGNVTFSAGGDAPLVVLADQGRKLSLSWPRPLPAPVLDGATATYREVLPGVDLSVAASVDGFSQALIVKNAEAAANPELATIDFGLRADGLTMKKDAESGVVSALNPAGQTVFSTSTARMWDSSGTEVQPPAPLMKSRKAAAPAQTPPSDLSPGTNSAVVGVQVTDEQLRLTPDQALLDSPETTYPVYIDPRMTGTRQAWTIAYKPHPTDSYWNGTGWSGGTTSEARVGYESSSGGTARSFFQVDSKFLAGVKVVDAQFQITQTHSWSCTAKPVELWLTDPISSKTTWKVQPTWDTRQDTRSYAHGNESVGCPDKAIDLSADHAAKKAAASKLGNLTFGLRAPQSAEDAKDAYSWKKFKPDAKLIVDFNRPPKAAWGLDTIPTTKVGTECGNGSTYKTLGNTTVRLAARVWDPDGGSVTAQFHLWATGKHDTGPKVFFDERVTRTVSAKDPKGSPVYVDVPKELLVKHLAASGGQFSWKVQAEDPADSAFASDWTPTQGAPGCRFGYDPHGPGETDRPKVTSADYPERSPESEGEGKEAGTPGTFTFTAPTIPDVSYYMWGLDRTPPNNRADPAGKGKPAVATVKPLTPGTHTLYVVAYDAGGNVSKPYEYVFVVKSPGIAGTPGDVHGDGKPDMFAIDGSNHLRLYGGTGNGSVAASVVVSRSEIWNGALVAHRGTLDGTESEDLLVLTGKSATTAGRKDLMVYPNNGVSDFEDATRYSVERLPNWETGEEHDLDAIKQIVSVGDITPDGENTESDLVAVIGDQLWFLPGAPGGAVEYGYPIGDSGWGRMTLASPGDMNGDGLTDLIARDTTNGTVWLYAGKGNDLNGNGKADDGTEPSSLGESANRTVYATGWTPAARPLITASGSSNEDAFPDLWTTTANATAGLEFFPGNKAGTVGTPTVVGWGGWQAIKLIS
ncbi:VCBS repeat-containing protein [Streptomyces sp. NPDC001985]|uniref:FG-GAP repeat domain-containing protein n=1 Tax=Streptomyces sp. NPDC001985 TaxID=3154406 RepID=UPI0033315C3D